MRYQFMFLRRIKFRIAWHADDYIPEITNFILDYSIEKGLTLLKVKVKRHCDDGKSKIWIWGTQSQKLKLAQALFEYAGKTIESTVV